MITPPTRRVYLAGGIEYAEDGGRPWRADFAAWARTTLGHECHDPSSHDHEQLTDEEKAHFRTWKAGDMPRFQQAVRKIIAHDLRIVLEHTDYIVCRWCDGTRRGTGTAGELTLAYWHSIPVYLKLEMPRVDVSSWLLGCATGVYDDWDTLKADLVRHYGGGVLAP